MLFLASALVVVSTRAVAHELDHQFHKHDVPCALHLYAGHLDGATPTPPAVPLATLTDAAPRPVVSAAAVVRRFVPYSVRAPPRSF